MVKVSKLNGDILYINPDLVRWVSCAPDTVLTFTDGKTLVIKESADQFANLIVAFKNQWATRTRGADIPHEMDFKQPELKI